MYTLCDLVLGLLAGAIQSFCSQHVQIHIFYFVYTSPSPV